LFNSEAVLWSDKEDCVQRRYQICEKQLFPTSSYAIDGTCLGLDFIVELDGEGSIMNYYLKRAVIAMIPLQ
jgi:hypothetical protein